QAEFLSGLLETRPDVVVFDVRPEALINRLQARRYCPVCGRIYNLVSAPPADPDHCDDDGMFLVCRVDDQADVIRERFRAYDQSTAPLLKHYGPTRIVRVDASRDCDGVAAQIEAALSAAEL